MKKGIRYDNNRFEGTFLENGIPVYIQRPEIIPDHMGVLIVFLPMVGSCVEDVGQHGLINVLNHVLMDQEGFRNFRIERKGIFADGFTSQKYSMFQIKASKDDFDQAVESLRYIVKPSFIDQHIDLGIKRAFCDHGRTSVNADFIFNEFYVEELFGENHPLSHLPVGDVHAIRNTSRALLEALHRQYYHSGNIHILCGGAFSEINDDIIIDRLNNVFGSIAKQSPCSVDFSISLDKKGVQSDVSLKNLSHNRFRCEFFKHDTLGNDGRIALDLLSYALSSPYHPMVSKIQNRYALSFSRLCSSSSSLAGWNFVVDVRSGKKNLSDIVPMFFELLSSIDMGYLNKVLLSRREKRQRLFCKPIDLCVSAVDVYVSGFSPQSHREVEYLEDSDMAERILGLTYQLSNERPFVLSAYSTV